MTAKRSHIKRPFLGAQSEIRHRSQSIVSFGQSIYLTSYSVSLILTKMFRLMQKIQNYLMVETNQKKTTEMLQGLILVNGPSIINMILKQYFKNCLMMILNIY